MLMAAAAIFFYAPTDWLQGVAQKIFYLHVSAAIAAYACFTVVLIAGVIFLRTENYAADRWARAGALVGVIFTTVTLVMGSIWARKVWGAFWVWDPRLTSTLVLWIIYAGYLLVRRLAEPGRQAARIGAAIGIFGFVDVPVVQFSVTWWASQHPGNVVLNDALPAEMLSTFLFTMLCTLVLAAVMVVIRYRIETLLDLKELVPRKQFVVAISQGDPEPAP